MAGKRRFLRSGYRVYLLLCGLFAWPFSGKRRGGKCGPFPVFLGRLAGGGAKAEGAAVITIQSSAVRAASVREESQKPHPFLFVSP